MKIILLCPVLILSFVQSEIIHPVDLETTFNWYCRSEDGKWFWHGRSIEQGYYKYIFTRGSWRGRFWKMEIMSLCCARYYLRWYDQLVQVCKLQRINEQVLISLWKASWCNDFNTHVTANSKESKLGPSFIIIKDPTKYIASCWVIIWRTI